MPFRHARKAPHATARRSVNLSVARPTVGFIGEEKRRRSAEGFIRGPARSVRRAEDVISYENSEVKSPITALTDSWMSATSIPPAIVSRPVSAAIGRPMASSGLARLPTKRLTS